MQKLNSILTFTALFVALSFTQSVFAQFDIPPIPKEQTSVYDYVGLLSGSEKSN